MKLSSINSSSKNLPEITKVTKPVTDSVDTKQVDTLSEEKTKNVEENVGPIPGMTKDDPDYDIMCKRLAKIKNRNPTLYKKLINWD